MDKTTKKLESNFVKAGAANAVAAISFLISLYGIIDGVAAFIDKRTLEGIGWALIVCGSLLVSYGTNKYANKSEKAVLDQFNGLKRENEKLRSQLNQKSK